MQDKVTDMEKQLAAINQQMERLMEEKEAYAEKAFRLQQVAVCPAWNQLPWIVWQIIPPAEHANLMCRLWNRRRPSWLPLRAKARYVIIQVPALDSGSH